MTGYDLIDIWAQAIMDASDFHDWCTETFGATVKIYVGLDESRAPGAKNCPYVLMHPLGDARGPEQDEHEWGVWLSLGIRSEDRKPDADAMKVVEPGLALMETEFCPRVLAILHGSSQPPHTGEGVTLPAHAGYVQRNVSLTLTEEAVLGLGENGWR